MTTGGRWVVGLLGFSILSAMGCAVAAPVVRLEPQNEGFAWREGRAVIRQERAGLVVAAAFDHQREDAVAFRVEVLNGSVATVDVDPARLLYVTCTAPATCSTRLAVIDPERVLLDLDQARARERAEQANAQTLGTALVIVDAAAAVGAAASGHGRAAADAGLQASVHASDAAEASAAHGAAITMIDGAHQDWSATALRHSTLYPSQGVAGLVFIPIDASAASVWLGVSAGSELFWFPFRQTVYRDDPGSQPAHGLHNR
jgi:hypothetical protein